MYIPAAFEVRDPDRLARFMRQYSFATVITQAPDGMPFASHVPVLFESEPKPLGRLLGHLARANPQWQHFGSSREVLLIFQGPHAYVSPRWYLTQPAVPTWNYAAVHAYGSAQLVLEESRLEQLVKQMVRFYEGDGEPVWREELPAEYLRKQLKAIVGFEIGITRLEGKFKLGQNRQIKDIAGVYQALSQSAKAGDRSLAEFMREQGLPEP